MPILHDAPGNHYLLDLDGTLVAGGDLLPGAGELLRRVAGRFAIVSNDSEHTAEQLSRRFRRWAINVAPANITLAGVTAIDAAIEMQPRARLMLLGSTALQRYAKSKGAELVTAAADVVVIARDRKFTYRKLEAAVRSIEGGAQIILACPDVRHPGPDGHSVPEAGALAAAIFAITGGNGHRTIGKPHPLLFETACRRAGLILERCWMIGDNPDTDGKGAEALGLPFLHVETGTLADRLVTG